MALVLGLDIGTTSTIGIVIETEGAVRAMASRPVRLASPHPGWAEEDPAEWWANVCALVPELLARAGARPEEITTIGVGGMLPAIVLLDGAGQVLRPSIQQSDGRCGAEVAEMAAELDTAAFLARTGNGINQQLAAPRLRWIARHEPAVAARIATVLGSYDYINFRLTGERAVEQNWALEAGLTDLARHAIADDLVALTGLPRTAVPRRVGSTEILGPVTPEAASATARPDARLFLDYHLIPGVYVPNGCMATGGSALNWFAATFAGGIETAGGSRHQALDRLAAAVPAGAEGLTVLPYFLGEKTPPRAVSSRG
jgi:xylulokinase